MTILAPSHFLQWAILIHVILLFYSAVVIIPKSQTIFSRSIKLLIMLMFPIIGSFYFIMDDVDKSETIRSNS